MKEKVPHHIFIRFELIPSSLNKPPRWFDVAGTDLIKDGIYTHYIFLISAEDEYGRYYNESKMRLRSLKDFKTYNFLKTLSLGRKPICYVIPFLFNESVLFRSIAKTMIKYGRKRVHFTTKLKEF